MVQRDVVTTETFDAGFELARKLRDPDLRARLGRLGWVQGQHMVVAMDAEPVVDVVARISFHDTSGRAIIAVPDATERHGFRLLGVEVVPFGQPLKDEITLGPGASIGMLSDLVRPCATYVPSRWTRALLFERASS